MSLRLARPILLAVLGFILILAVSIAAVVFASSDAGSVSVATDASSYAPGDPVTVTRGASRNGDGNRTSAN